MHFLNTVDYRGLVTGTTRLKLTQAEMRKIVVPIASAAVMKAVVAEIEKQFSRLDQAVASLKRVKAQLNRYKASVLKAAVEGRLVETEAERARREGRSFEPGAELAAQESANAAGGRKPEAALPYETGEQLLKRILDTRRSQWKGKGKYKEPAAPDTAGLPELPEGWVWATVDTVLNRIEAGSSFKCLERPPVDGEFGVVKVSAVTWGTFDESESKTCTDVSRINDRLLVARGDFLFSRANTIESWPRKSEQRDRWKPCSRGDDDRRTRSRA